MCKYLQITKLSSEVLFSSWQFITARYFFSARGKLMTGSQAQALQRLGCQWFIARIYSDLMEIYKLSDIYIYNIMKTEHSHAHVYCIFSL